MRSDEMRNPSFGAGFRLFAAAAVLAAAPPLVAQDARSAHTPGLTLASSVRGIVGTAALPLPWPLPGGHAERDTAFHIGWKPQADETAPMYAWSVDAMTAAAGLARLRSLGALGSARREVRMWMGFGIGAPDWMLRMVDEPGGARGELRFWWTGERARIGRFHGTPRQRAGHEALHRRFSRQMRGDTRRAGCTEWTESLDLETCRFTFRREPDWNAVLAAVDSLDAWTLANPATLTPPMRGGMHGSTLIVEVRDGDRYRTYAYWCPSLFPNLPEAARAHALAQLAEPMLARWRAIMSARFEAQERKAHRERLRRERAKI
jgi:hypothetical protein